MFTFIDLIGAGLFGVGIGIVLVLFFGMKQRRP